MVLLDRFLGKTFLILDAKTAKRGWTMTKKSFSKRNENSIHSRNNDSFESKYDNQTKVKRAKKFVADEVLFVFSIKKK